MPKRIVVIQGHPDPDPQRFGRALAQAYADGARAGRHEVRLIDVAALGFPLLHTQAEWLHGSVPPELKEAQAALGWADHWVILFPLWLGSMPALLKGFLEQVGRPGFVREPSANGLGRKLLVGKSARIVVTMGMPAFVYRWYFGAHSLKSLERNILRFCGIGPIRESLFGMVESGGPRRHRRYLEKLRLLGTRGR